MKKIFATLFLFACVTYGYAQSRRINLEKPVVSTQPNYIASESITLKPGFSSGTFFTAKIDETATLAEDYLPQAISTDPANRPFDTSAPVSLEQGRVNVSPTGAATYHFPINIPAGIAGMQPNISIDYNSQGGDGALGLGWYISGISAISRVPEYSSPDLGPVCIKFDTSDQYSLDGNRLDENPETYFKAASIGSIPDFPIPSPNGPGGWLIKSKDEKISEYGGTSESRIVPGFDEMQTAPIAWQITKVTDSNKNYIKYSYKRYHGESVVEKIEYTGTANSTPYNTIQFFYDIKDDVKYQYISGRKIGNSLLLRAIKVYTEGSVVKTYDFDYAYNNGQTYLNIINENIGENNKLNSTIIQWGIYKTNLETVIATVDTPDASAGANVKTWTSGDVNGDGISDMISSYWNTDQSSNFDIYTASVTFSGGVSFVKSPSIFSNSLVKHERTEETKDLYWYVGGSVHEPRENFCGNPVVCNIDNDGKPDVVVPYWQKGFNGKWSDERPLVEVNWGYKVISSSDVSKDFNTNYTYREMKFGSGSYDLEKPAIAFGDLNNDGIDEAVFALMEGTDHQYHLKTSTGVDMQFGDGQIISVNKNAAYPPKVILINDFDADGRNDILLFTAKGSILFKNNSDGTFINMGLNTTIYTPYVRNLRICDYNNDNLPDLLVLTNTSNQQYLQRDWKVFVNNGDGTFTMAEQSGIYSNFLDPDVSLEHQETDRDDCIILDFNSDGKNDVIVIHAVYFSNNGYIDYNFEISYYAGIKNGNGFSFIKKLTVDKNKDFSFYYLNSLGDFNGDGKVDLLNYGADFSGSGVKDSNFRIYSTFDPEFDGGVVTKIRDGLNKTTSLAYQPLAHASSGTYYKKTTTNTYPLTNETFPLRCVKKLEVPNGVDGISEIKYSYEDLNIHVKGKGILGFSKINVINTALNRATKTTTELDLSTYSPSKQTIETSTYSSNIPLSKVENNFTNVIVGSKQYKFINSNVVTNSLNGTTTTTTYDYLKDNAGNYTSDLNYVTVDYGSGFSTTTNYSNYVQLPLDQSSFYQLCFYVNKPGIVKITRKHSDDGAFTSTTKYSYNTTQNNCNIEGIVENYGVAGKEVTTLYRGFDNLGNPMYKDISFSSEGNGYSNTQTFGYDKYGRTISVSDNLNSQTFEYDPKYGNLIKSTDTKKGLSTQSEYDSGGRFVKTSLSDGNITNTRIEWSQGGGPAHAVYYSLTETSGQPWVKTWYDVFGRELRKESVGYKGMSIYTDTKYNALGQITDVITKAGGTTTSSVTYGYQDDGRVKSEKYLNGRNLDYLYTSNQVKITENGTNETTNVYDIWGNLISVNKPTSGGTINYLYSSTGKPKSIQTTTSLVTMTYDEIGNQTSLTDPDAGIQIYRYDAGGRITYQKDGKGFETKYLYDPQGRLFDKQRITGESLTNILYNTSGSGYGEVSQVTQYNGAFDKYEYDLKGRVNKTTRHIDATIGDVVFQFHHDDYGNIDKITYPDNSDVNQTFESGILTKVARGNVNIWELNEQTALKLQYTLGNGLVTVKEFDQNGYLKSINTGNGTIQSNSYSYIANRGLLESRSDLRKGYLESFTYDESDRLKSWDLTKGAVSYAHHEVSYLTDKINAKSDFGSYTYGSNHAVKTVFATGEIGSPLKPHDITYNEFGKLNSIIENNNNLEIVYGADEQRSKSILTQNGTVTCTSYFAGLYEAKKIYNDVTKGYDNKEFYYIQGGDGVAAVLLKINSSAGDLFYIHKDNLGSIVSLTDANKNPKDEVNYDPWGRRRNIDNYSYSNIALPTILTRGFTGHEHLDVFNLINMNGRVYDPLMGNFISCDNLIQSPTMPQNFNRYAYCLYNPLKYTDPTGDSWWDQIGNWLDMNNITIQFGINTNFTGFTPYINAGGPSWNIGVGYDAFNGNWGTQTQSNGFSNFYYPSVNYNASVENAVKSVNSASGAGNRIVQSEEALRNVTSGIDSNNSVQIGQGLCLTGGFGYDVIGGQISIGVFGSPGKMGQLFFSFNNLDYKEKGNAFFDSSISAQYMIGGTRLGGDIDLGGQGTVSGLGIGPVSGGYSSDLDENLLIYQFGPSIGYHVTWGKLRSKTITIPVQMPIFLSTPFL